MDGGAALQDLQVHVGSVALSGVEMSRSSLTLTFSSAQRGGSGCRRNSYRAKTAAIGRGETKATFP